MQNKKKFDVFSLSSYFVLLAILVVFGIFGNNFLKLKSIYATINNGLPLILITCAVTFSLIVGIIDLSCAAIGYAAGVTSGMLMHWYGVPFPLALLVGLVIGVFLGWINSLLIVKLKMNGMLVTFGMMLVLRAYGRIITNDNTITLGDHVKALRQARIAALGGLQVTVIVMIVFAVVLHLVLTYTAFGRKLLLVGCDENVARRIGINADKVKTRALLLEGLLCGFAGSFFWIVVEGAIVTTGLNSYEFLAIAGACLGGISLLGGRGTIFPGAVIGSLILLFLAAGMSNAGISIFVTPFVRGVIIFIAMYIDSLRTRRMMGNKLG